MGKMIVCGGRALSGEIPVGGSKNAALPLLFASLITRGVSTFYNLPAILDVEVTLSILKSFGARILRYGNKTEIDSRGVEYCIPDPALVSRLRASSYLLGSCLVSFGKAQIMRFGGCNFDKRPIDMHLYAMRSFGAEISGESVLAPELHGADIRFDKISVGATVNAVIMAAGIKEKSRIYGYAAEPHVFALLSYLSSCGASIAVSSDYVEISGGELMGGCAEIIPDMIEAGSFAVLSMMSGCSVSVGFDNHHELSSFYKALEEGGAELDISHGIRPVCRPDLPLNIVTAPHPGFPTDLQPQTAPLLAVCRGGRITDTVWRSRFGYLDGLASFGVISEIGNGYADIYPSRLKAAKAYAPDLRGGMAYLIAALCAVGTSVIDNSEIIFRGYENIIEKLRAVGAEIYEE